MDPSANRLDLTKVLYYITRSPGVHVPLVPVDELPDFLDIEGIPRRADPEQLKCLIPLDPLPRHPHSKLCVTIGGQPLRAPSSVVLPSQKAYSAPDAEIKTKRFSAESGPSKLPDHADRMDAIIGKHAATQPRDPEEECRAITEFHAKRDPKLAASVGYIPQRPLPPSGKEPDPRRKEYCTYWIQTGGCGFIQQGCLFKHEMPDKETLAKIGFPRIPKWYAEKSVIKIRGSSTLEQMDGVGRDASKLGRRVWDGGKPNPFGRTTGGADTRPSGLQLSRWAPASAFPPATPSRPQDTWDAKAARSSSISTILAGTRAPPNLRPIGRDAVRKGSTSSDSSSGPNTPEEPLDALQLRDQRALDFALCHSGFEPRAQLPSTTRSGVRPVQPRPELNPSLPPETRAFLTDHAPHAHRYGMDPGPLPTSVPAPYPVHLPVAPTGALAPPPPVTSTQLSAEEIALITRYRKQDPGALPVPHPETPSRFSGDPFPHRPSPRFGNPVGAPRDGQLTTTGAGGEGSKMPVSGPPFDNARHRASVLISCALPFAEKPYGGGAFDPKQVQHGLAGIAGSGEARGEQVG